MCGVKREKDYTGLFRLNFFLTLQKLWYIQNSCSCPVLSRGELKPLKPHWQTIKWYQLSKQISVALYELMRKKCLFVGNGDCEN